ncbi:hypothetical protein [Methylophaga sp.]|uniref:hypothetical protein n=1 Tax=Methylophaga sp. TaxID=2024840 RepID=UPI003A90FDCA
MQKNSDRYTGNNDISLVELTVIVVRWRRLFFAVFLGLSLVTAVYAFITPEKRESIGLYQLAKSGDGEYLTDVAGVVSTISSVWIPQLLLEHEGSARGVPSITVTNPKETGLIRLQTLAPEAQSELVTAIHKNLVERLDSWQSAVYQDAVSRIELRVGHHTNAIEQMLEETGPSEAVSVLMEYRIELEHRLDKMKKGEILTVASRGDGGAATSRSLIIVVGLLVAFVIATLLSFMAEFVTLVRKSANSKVLG